MIINLIKMETQPTHNLPARGIWKTVQILQQIFYSIQIGRIKPFLMEDTWRFVQDSDTNVYIFL